MRNEDRRVIIGVIAAAVVLVGTACSRGGEPIDDTTGVSTPPTAAYMSGSVDSMAGAALYEYASNGALWSDSTEADRLCEGADLCNRAVNTKKVRVRIWAHKAAKDIADSTVPVHGALVAKLENIGDAKERMYGLEPGNVYLLFLFRGDDTSGRYRIEEVKKTAPFAHRTVKEGTQIRCNHPREWAASWATFVDCAHGPPTPPWEERGAWFGLVKTAYARENPVATSTPSPPAWITCPSGCCTSGGTETVQLQ